MQPQANCRGDHGGEHVKIYQESAVPVSGNTHALSLFQWENWSREYSWKIQDGGWLEMFKAGGGGVQLTFGSKS